MRGITLGKIVSGMEKFRNEFKGKFCIQMMFIKENKKCAKKMAEWARRLKPDEVQIGTPLRPSPVPPLSPKEMRGIEKSFRNLPWISVYKRKKPKVKPLDLKETLARRPGEHFG